jgi:hypothetical protein
MQLYVNSKEMNSNKKKISINWVTFRPVDDEIAQYSNIWVSITQIFG